MKGKEGRRSRDLQKAAGSRDRLSNLPNDVLLNILERVGTLDAIRTCILSKQMLKLPTMVSRIIIDVYSFYSLLLDYDESRVETVRDLVRINGAVADVTDKILSTRSPQITIRKLKVRFILRRYDCLSIGKSVARAMASQKLDAVEFKILTEKDSEQCTHADYLYYAKLFNTFLGDCPDAFAGLTRLHLQHLRFGQSDIPNILSTCKLLESLRFFECDAGICSVLQVEHARLVELEITFGDFEAVELNCLPKLQRMTYDNWSFDEIPLFFGFVPQLSKLSLTNTGVSDKTLKLSQLLANVPCISDLHLDFESEKIWVRPECPKRLAPVLNKLRLELSITVWDHWCQTVRQHRYERTDVKWEPSAYHFKHENLAKLTIYGFQSDYNFMRYVRRVMEAAVNIEEISLHDRKVCEFCAADLDPEIKVCPSRYPRTGEEKDSLREKITGALGMASPAVIHFRS